MDTSQNSDVDPEYIPQTGEGNESDYEDDTKTASTVSSKRQTNKPSVAWRHFRKLGDFNALCIYCHNVFSYKSTVTNLIKHFMAKHKNVELRDSQYQSGATSTGNRKKRWTYMNDAEFVRTTKDTEVPSVKFSSEIWRRFDIEDDEARCSICRDEVATNIEDMKTHLEENHTQILDEIIAKAQKSLDSDNENDDDNLYTEVVYLEDEPKSRPKITPKRKERQIFYETPKPEKPENTEKQDDLEAFINYIRCLLKKVPKESTHKLQLDIINLIVNAQTPKVQNVQNTVENGGVSGHRVITVPIQNLMGQDKVIIPNLYVAPSDGNISITSSSSLNNNSTVNTVVSNARNTDSGQ